MTKEEILKGKTYLGTAQENQKLIVVYNDAISAMEEYSSIQTSELQERVKKLEEGIKEVVETMLYLGYGNDNPAVVNLKQLLNR